MNRALRQDGTLWLNLGDSYAAGGRGKAPPGLKPKDLVGIPWRVAFALQADGWYLRSDIIWHKPNPMPESVTDRPTKAHEYLFLMSKSTKYFYDYEAIKEGIKESTKKRYLSGWNGDRKRGYIGSIQNNLHKYMGSEKAQKATTKNKNTVWAINIKPYSGAHFAVFPSALIEPCILAGTKRGDIVLDPFNGSGTVGHVCKNHGRRYIGIELNEDYLKLNPDRIGRQGVLI